MRKLLAALRKEWFILVRDLPGLGILFLMPVLLIFVVTLAQENALKSQVELTSVGFSAPEGSMLGAQIRDDIHASGMFTLEVDYIQPDEIYQAIRQGRIPLGIIVLAGDSAVRLVIDPTMHEAFKASLQNTARFLVRGAEGKVMMKRMIAAGGSDLVADADNIFHSLPPIIEEQAVKERSSIKPTPVQNNIPGFILFAMFFIVIPLSGSLISEKNEGAYARIKALPVGFKTIIGAKVLLYVIVCLVQFLLMLFIGLYLLHGLFGFPKLEMGSSLWALSIATLAAALGAVGFGVLVGTGSRTHGQAALFGSVLVVILGIISGTFLPIHVMPEAIRVVSSFSPVRWGIDNYLELFIRDGTLIDILPRTLWLLLFFIFAMLISMTIFAKRN